MLDSKEKKEYFFLLSLKRCKTEEANENVEFTNSENKGNIPKCILTKEMNEYIIKVFKFSKELVNKDYKAHFEFFYDGNQYKLNLDRLRDRAFLFDVDLEQSKNKKLDISEKMNYFDEALNVQKEYDKKNILYKDSINICDKKPNFQFLINIFVKIYNTELCPKLLGLFNKNKNKLVENNNKENLSKYKFDFDSIVECLEEIISKYSFNLTDFYGLILCYLNICNNEKFRELFDKLAKKEESQKILFEVMLTYKLFLKKQFDINEDILSAFIKYATKKDFTIFKEDALFYLKDINTFIKIIEKNKADIIKIKGFEPIVVLKIKDDEVINFGIINPKIKLLTDFSKDQKKLLLYLNENFWENIAKKSFGINRENIELCSTIREIFKNYYNMILDIFKDKDKIKNEMKITFKRGIFLHQIDKIIQEYIANNPDISNLEIIEIIHDYDEYYTNSYYWKKREPKILEKIDFEKIKIDLEKKNEIFINKFKEMEFEKIFANDLQNYLLVFTNKLKKITDFDIIFKMINIDALGAAKNIYLKQIKNKYPLALKANELSENDPNLIKSLVNLTTYICVNENKVEFLEKTINESKIIKPSVMHKIYIGLINFCKENKNECTKNIKNFIIKHYTGSIQQEKLKEFIDFIINLNEDDANDFIEKIDDKYNIIEKDFYSPGINLNIQLINELLIKNKLNLNDDNKYKKKI